MESFTGIRIIVKRFSFLYIACYKAMLKKASISRHQLGKYTQREKEKNFYLDQSRKQDIEYPWKKSITAQLFMPSLH